MSAIVSLHSAGCLPDSDSYPITFDSIREAWEYVAQEVELIAYDGDYLAAHTALHIQDIDATGAIPADESGIYRYSVETAE